MSFEVVFACIGALTFAAIGIGIASLMVSYAHTMWGRFSAREWYRKGREDEANGDRDYFEDQPKPSWKW